MNVDEFLDSVVGPINPSAMQQNLQQTQALQQQLSAQSSHSPQSPPRSASSVSASGFAPFQSSQQSSQYPPQQYSQQQYQSQQYPPQQYSQQTAQSSPQFVQQSSQPSADQLSAQSLYNPLQSSQSARVGPQSNAATGTMNMNQSAQSNMSNIASNQMSPMDPAMAAQRSPSSSSTPRPQLDNPSDQFESLSLTLETSLASGDYQHAFDTYIAIQSALARMTEQHKLQQQQSTERLNEFKQKLFSAVQASSLQFQAIMHETYMHIGQIRELADKGDVAGADALYGTVKKTIEQLPIQLSEKRAKLDDDLLKVYLYLKDKREHREAEVFASIANEMKRIYVNAVAAIKTGNLTLAQQLYEQLAGRYAQLPEGYTDQKIQLFDYVTFLHSQLTLAPQLGFSMQQSPQNSQNPQNLQTPRNSMNQQNPQNQPAQSMYSSPQSQSSATPSAATSTIASQKKPAIVATVAAPAQKTAAILDVSSQSSKSRSSESNVQNESDDLSAANFYETPLQSVQSPPSVSSSSAASFSPSSSASRPSSPSSSQFASSLSSTQSTSAFNHESKNENKNESKNEQPSADQLQRRAKELTSRLEELKRTLAQ